MNTTDDAILTFAEAFARLGDRKHSELYLEALASIVRMAKAEERHSARMGQIEEEEQMAHAPVGMTVVMH